MACRPCRRSSRLNRKAQGKDDTFVLDFVNEREDSSRPSSNTTGRPRSAICRTRTSSTVSSTSWESIDRHRQGRNHAVSARSGTVTAGNPRRAEHRQLNGILDKAVSRFDQLSEEDKDKFKGKLISFRNLYGFLAQIIPYQDSDLEKLYTYARFLLLKLPRRADGAGYELEDEVALRFYRLQKISEGNIGLEEGEAEPLKGPTEVGTGRYKDKDIPLSRFGGQTE